MYEMLEGIEPYNNIGALMGLAGGLSGNDELMGEIGKLPFGQRIKVLSQFANTGGASKGSRAEMEKLFGELPQYIKDGLMKGELRLADTVIYSIKAINGSKTIKLFETQDDKEIGLRNVSNAKLPKNQAFVVSGIMLLAGVPAEVTKDKIIATQYSGLESFAAVANGEFSLKSNKKQIVPETANSVFKTANMHNVPIGFYKLANPRIIHDDIQIEMTVELGSVEGLDPKTHIYAALLGTITTP